MKIGLNTYSFRKEIETGKYSLEDIWEIANKIGYIEGIELLDRHIPGWSDGDFDEGIKHVIEQLESYGWPLIGLGPHFKLYQRTPRKIQNEIEVIKKWIDLAANNNIPDVRAQVGGPFKYESREKLPKHVNVVKELLDKVLPYAKERNVKICIETHHRLSSWPPFLDQLTQYYKDIGSLGINYDWGNFPNNEQRYKTLDIAIKPYNHAHNHVKIFNFGKNFQETEYDTIKIVNAYRDANFKDYFSIEFEGSQNAIKGVYKSVHALKYAISNGKHEIDTNFDWKILQNK